MELEKIIEFYHEFFDYVKKEDKKIVILKNDAPEELRDSVYKVHGDRLPDDYFFDWYDSILSTLQDYDIESMDDIEENRHEIVDGLVSVYTHDLTEWLNSNNSNVYYITEVQEQFGAITDGFKLLAAAQYMAIDEVYAEVINLLTEKLESGE